MKLRSRARRAAIVIKREDWSLQTKASNKACGLVPDATLSVKQESKSCTLIKQEEPFSSALVNSSMQVEPNEVMDKAIKQEDTSKTKIALGKYVDKLQGD